AGADASRPGTAAGRDRAWPQGVRRQLGSSVELGSISAAPRAHSGGAAQGGPRRRLHRHRRRLEQERRRTAVSDHRSWHLRHAERAGDDGVRAGGGAGREDGATGSRGGGAGRRRRVQHQSVGHRDGDGSGSPGRLAGDGQRRLRHDCRPRKGALRLELRLHVRTLRPAVSRRLRGDGPRLRRARRQRRIGGGARSGAGGGARRQPADRHPGGDGERADADAGALGYQRHLPQRGIVSVQLGSQNLEVGIRDRIPNSKFQIPNSSLAWSVWGVAATYYLAAFYLRSAPAVMTTEMMRDFGISASQLGNFSAVYFYAYIAMQIPTGVLVDSWGARRLLIGGAIAAAMGTCLFGATSSYAVASVGRLIVGAATA